MIRGGMDESARNLVSMERAFVNTPFVENRPAAGQERASFVQQPLTMPQPGCRKKSPGVDICSPGGKPDAHHCGQCMSCLKKWSRRGGGNQGVVSSKGVGGRGKDSEQAGVPSLFSLYLPWACPVPAVKSPIIYRGSFVGLRGDRRFLPAAGALRPTRGYFAC